MDNKITDEQAASIRFWRAQGVTNKKLARLYGVKPTTISAITKGRRHGKPKR